MTQLQWLNLNENQLVQVPAELGKLTQLRHFLLRGNQLTSLPAELGQLSQLLDKAYAHGLDLADNPNLHHPPPDVVAGGTEAILTYLRNHQSGRTHAS